MIITPAAAILLGTVGVIGLAQVIVRVIARSKQTYQKRSK